MADKDQYEVVFGLGLFRDSAECFRHLAASGLSARERVDMRLAAGSFQQLIEIVGHGGEALLIVGFAPEP